MSRAVSVLRTGIVDSGLGMDVLRIVLGKELGDRFGGSVSSPGTAKGSVCQGTSSSECQQGKRIESIRNGEAMDVADVVRVTAKQKGLGEDGRVLSAALSAVCNIVNDFSPLRPVSTQSSLFDIESLIFW